MFNFSNWFCSQKEHIRKIYPELSYNWYIENQQNNNGAFHEKMIRCDITKNPYQYPGYARTKIKSKNVQEIYTDIRQNRSNFIDDQFPHVQLNVSKDQLDTRSIQWKRVSQVVHNAVFSLPPHKDIKDDQYLFNYKSNNLALQICLTLISRTHPKKLQRIRNHKLSDEGLYQFKLFKDGIIHNVIIDDYVPAFKGFHVFTGPANDVQVYPMLLEKAIAKISKGYSQIPKNPLEIMEMIYCGAIRRQNLDNLRDLQQFRELVKRTLQKDGLTVLIAKNDKKIRQYGINDSEIYQIIGQFQIKLQHNKQQHTLYQILSENKMSAWNGCYRATDPIWKNVQTNVKQQIFKKMKQNHSFFVVDNQIYRVFEHLIVYQDTQTMNKDWLQTYSENGYLSFNRFQLKQKDQVFVRVTCKQAIKQHLIICKDLGGDQYQLIGGDFNDNSQFLECHIEIDKGNYLICVIQQWITKKQGEYFIYLSSTCRTALVPEIQQIQNFLQKLFINHSATANKDLQSIFYRQLRNIGLGYLRILVKPPSTIKKIKINFKKIRDNDWEVLSPFDDMQDVVTTSSALIVLKMLRKPPKELNVFPLQAFTIMGD